MRVLVTGGAGFIGSHTVDLLRNSGIQVTVLDDLSRGRIENLEPHLKTQGFHFVRGDVRDTDAVRRAVESVDAVVHEAAFVSVPLSLKNPEFTMGVNVGGTRNLLKACVEEGVKRFVYASSCAVYGEASRLPLPEDAPLDPLSPYARSKLEAERECLRFFEDYGLQSVCLRYFNVYGPRQVGGEYGGVMIRFIERLKRDLPPVIYGDGEQTRDFIYVEDVAKANLLALRHPDAGGKVFNIGSGRGVTINELCSIFLKLTGKSLEPIHLEPREGDIRRSLADIRRARDSLGFEPSVSLEEGIMKLLKSFKFPFRRRKGC